jgi:DNA modification methylase
MSDTTFLLGDSLDILSTWSDSCVDSIVTDPPAGISFMGKKWDSNKGGSKEWIEWMSNVAAECLRVMQPGGHALVWAIPRTSHWTATAWESAGWEVRDRISHVFGTGFPKNHNISKAIDKAAGAVGVAGSSGSVRNSMAGDFAGGEYLQTAPATNAAKQWEGWGTALKPAMEDWWLLRKPLAEKTIAKNVLEHGTGAINIDACRVGYEENDRLLKGGSYGGNRKGSPGESIFGTGGAELSYEGGLPQGRWPANFIHDGSDEVLSLFPNTKSHGGRSSNTGFWSRDNRGQKIAKGDQGSAARFFYCAKPTSKDRNEGVSTGKNIHPTVKSTELMRHLVRLVTPPEGVCLDPFMGSGSTGKACVAEGFSFIGIEKEEEYFEIAKERIEFEKDKKGVLDFF